MSTRLKRTFALLVGLALCLLLFSMLLLGEDTAAGEEHESQGTGEEGPAVVRKRSPLDKATAKVHRRKELAVVAEADTLLAYEKIVEEYFADVVPFMRLTRRMTREEYVEFSLKFQANRNRMTELRKRGGWGEVKMAMVAAGSQLINKPRYNNVRVDLKESMVIPAEVIAREMKTTLERGFHPGDDLSGLEERLAQNGCTERTMFCLNKPWVAQAVGLGVDYAVIWDDEEDWASDYERLREYDVLILLDYPKDILERVTDVIVDVGFDGAVLQMPSEAASMIFGSIFQRSAATNCHVLLDNYWLAQEKIGVPMLLYPLWFRYPDAWRALGVQETGVKAGERRYAYVAKISNRATETERYREERRSAATFFEGLGYEVNDEAGSFSFDYNEYFGRCKYAFLPFIERNSTGQIIADAMVSSNFTALPFSYGHKLWMRTLPPYLTVSSVEEMKEKVLELEADEEMYERLLADVRRFAEPFTAMSTLETKEELLAGVMMMPVEGDEGDRSCRCFRMPVEGQPPCPPLAGKKGV